MDQNQFIYNIAAIQCSKIPKPGCNIKIPNLDPIVLPMKESDCESVLLANKYNGGEDFYLLLNSLFPKNQELINHEEQIIQNKEGLDRLPNIKGISVYYLSPKLIKQDFSELIDKIEFSNICETINFFGVPLFCFNRIDYIGKTYKDNLKIIIPYFSLLKSASSLYQVNNLLFNEKHFAYDFIVNNKISFWDGSKHNAYGETKEETKCGGGAGNYQDKKNRVYLCNNTFKVNFPTVKDKVSYATIMYHEANHKFPGSIHEYNRQCKKTKNLNIAGDKGLKSVYGAHLNLLLTMSKDEHLPCKYRKMAWKQTQFQIKNKFCNKPGIKHNYQEPICISDELFVIGDEIIFID